MGQLFMVNPPGRRKRRKKPRSAAQRRATKKMLAARKRATASKRSTTRTKRSSTMARKARRTRSTTRRKRRTSAKRRSPGVRLVRRGVAVYQGNPKRRRRRGGRRRSYGRNPSLIGTLRQGAMDALATLGGGAAARVVSNVVPLGNEGIMGTAKGLLVALGVGFGARKFLSADTARFVTAGAMQVPIKNLITSFVPQAGAFLGDYDSIAAYEGVEGYVGGASADGGYAETMGSYEVTY